MLCSNCGKRPAVVFVSDSSGNNQKGYCLSCADKLNIKPVKDLMNKMGITSEQLENMQDSMDSLMEMNGGEIPGMSDLGSMLGDAGFPVSEDDDDSDNPDKFSQGGAPTFPFGIFHVMGLA